MVVVLPPELINEIFRLCCNDSLTQCALGNKTFLHLARAHLYYAIKLWHNLEYTMSCPSRAQIFIHTKHISFERFYKPSISFIGDIYQLGRLETVVKEYSSTRIQTILVDVHDDPEHLDMLFQLLSLPTVRRLALSIEGRLPPVLPPSLVALLASPKLRDLQALSLSPFIPVPPQNLDTLRTTVQEQDLFEIDYTILRRLALDVRTPGNLQIVETCMKNWFASISHYLTHLALHLGTIYFVQGDSLNPSSLPIFADLGKLTSLSSLSLDVLIKLPYAHLQLELVCLILEHVSPIAPLRMVHIILQCSNSDMPNFIPALNRLVFWNRIPQVAKSRFPHSRLSFYFQVSQTMGKQRDDGISFELPKHLVGVDMISGDLRGQPFFSGEISDEFLHDYCTGNIYMRNGVVILLFCFLLYPVPSIFYFIPRLYVNYEEHNH